jgi:hypothetical protein
LITTLPDVPLAFVDGCGVSTRFAPVAFAVDAWTIPHAVAPCAHVSVPVAGPAVMIPFSSPELVSTPALSVPSPDIVLHVRTVLDEAWTSCEPEQVIAAPVPPLAIGRRPDTAADVPSGNAPHCIVPVPSLYMP